MASAEETYTGPKELTPGEYESRALEQLDPKLVEAWEYPVGEIADLLHGEAQELVVEKLPLFARIKFGRTPENEGEVDALRREARSELGDVWWYTAVINRLMADGSSWTDFRLQDQLDLTASRLQGTNVSGLSLNKFQDIAYEHRHQVEFWDLFEASSQPAWARSQDPQFSHIFAEPLDRIYWLSILLDRKAWNYFDDLHELSDADIASFGGNLDVTIQALAQGEAVPTFDATEAQAHRDAQILRLKQAPTHEVVGNMLAMTAIIGRSIDNIDLHEIATFNLAKNDARIARGTRGDKGSRVFDPQFGEAI